jgi:hypothetical protein
MRRQAHAFLAAGDHDLGISVADRLEAERHGAEPRPAELVDLKSRLLIGNARRNRRLARRVLALARGQDLAENHLGDFAGLDLGPLQHFDDRRLAELMRRQLGERPAKGSDRGPRGGSDDDVLSILGHGAYSSGGWWKDGL